MTIKERVYSFIKLNEGTSYVELEQLFDEQGFDWKGDLAIYSDEDENVIFWIGWNQQAVMILNDLQREGLICKVPGQYLTYLLDGRTLDLPVVRRDKKYRKPHWLPILFAARRKSLEQIIAEIEREVENYERV